MDWHFFRNVFVKGLGLFLLANLIFAAWNPSNLGKISLYNRVFPGRLRFPFGEQPTRSYNLSLFDLNAMFAAHEIAAGVKPDDEYRIVLVGDSSVWGILLQPEVTLSGQLNKGTLEICAGRHVHVYNLGYPTISLTKDLMVLDQAMQYQPDLIVWLVTLEAFPISKQLSSPIVANNAVRIQSLIQKYGLAFNPHDPTLVQPTIWSQTILGQRRNLADLIRLQMYGVLWSATGIDQTYPQDYQPAQVDFNADQSFQGMQPPVLDSSKLSFDVLEAGLRAAGTTPVILVNEPMLISTGKNSDLRYNFFYPRWAYDQYRSMMTARARSEGWNYFDLWDLVPANEFTNSAIHLTPEGEAVLTGRIRQAMSQQECP